MNERGDDNGRSDRTAKAAEYRRIAAECIEVADNMSLAADRERLLAMARNWLSLAKLQEGG
jgi:hypothetical protein